MPQTNQPNPPALLLIPGSWHTPQSLKYLQSHLESQGYPTETISHPSNGSVPPTETLSDDTTYLRTTLTRLIEEEHKSVVLISHSYGGLVMSNASAGFGKPDREARGLDGGIILLVYMAAMVVGEGQSLFGSFGEWRPEWMGVEGDYCRALSPLTTFYHDLTPQMQEEAVAQLTHSSLGAYTEVVGYEPWRAMRCAYILCEEDRAMPVAVQEMLVGMMRAGAVFPVLTGRLPASHSPFYSMPGRTAGVIGGFIAEVLGERV
ncbi:hypothetical protein ETB97_009827 [Aspergillus alliaceus]|uniref:Alpha/beta hydrolase fold-1 n=1 Tax=Petromyces alliaceus TaxID=209559 RepID=A0A5N7BR89_PETAA|nr:Alpha/beta hydrolase fold-1 [Aspergillus alliaceus]KAF5855152.1 hypothetical protein ETB97_009827 [Aspergillus burnettii]